MYIDLGGDIVVKSDEISGIFDMDTSTVNKATRDFLAQAEREGRVIYASYDLPKSFVVCGEKIYVCEYNTSTIFKRIRNA